MLLLILSTYPAGNGEERAPAHGARCAVTRTALIDGRGQQAQRLRSEQPHTHTGPAMKRTQRAAGRMIGYRATSKKALTWGRREHRSQPSGQGKGGPLTGGFPKLLDSSFKTAC